MKLPLTLLLHRSVSILGVASLLSLGGCLAQQADLKNTSKQLKSQIDAAKVDLNNQIQEAKKELDRMVLQKSARLNEDITQLRERELASVSNALEKRAYEGEKLRQNQDDLLARLDRTSKELREQSNVVAAARTELKAEQERFRAEIKAEQERLRTDQERFRSDFRDAVTKDLSKLSGDSSAQLAKLNIRADELAARLTTAESVFKKAAERIEDQNREIKTSDQRAATLTQRLEAQDKALGELRQALADFKQVLGSLGEKIVTQDKSASELSGSVSQQTTTLGKRVEAIAAELKMVTQHMNEVNKSTAQHLEDVNKSVATLAKAVEAAGDKFVARLDAQDQRLEQMTKQVAWLQDAAKTLDSGGGKFVSRLESQDQRMDQMAKQVAWLQDAAKTLESSGDRFVPRMEAQEQRLEQMAKQIEWLQEVAKQRDGRSAPIGNSSYGTAAAESSEGKPATAKLTRPPDAGPSFSGPSARDTVRERYEQLLARMREGDLDHAQEGFVSFLSEHPTSELAPNARFWLGESYYGKKDYRRAIDAYERVERDYPSSEKVPAALLKKGYAYLALRDTRQAASVFQLLATRYPKTQEAGKANEKLAQLKRER